MLGSDEPVTWASTGDLNRSPATTVELLFREVTPQGVKTGLDHAYILLTDNATGEQWINEARPSGPKGDGWFPYPMGTVRASGKKYVKEVTGYGQPYHAVARHVTDESTDSIRRRLDDFAESFNKKNIPYSLPDLRVPFVGFPKNPLFPTPNSNYYAGLAWEHLTGSTPRLPSAVDAPGWRDHLIEGWGRRE